MNKALFQTATTMFLALFLLTACAEQGRDDTVAAKPGDSAMPAATTEAAEKVSLLDQPVDFSSPEAVEKTLLNIREQDGDVMYSKLKAAMEYILYYDLSLGNDKNKLYKKLDGQTPNEIVARARKR